MIFFEVILPVFIIMLLGYVGQKAMKMDISSVSNIALYILTPPLIFRVFYDTPINIELAYVAVYSLLLSLCIVALVYILVKCRLIPLENQRAMMMSTAFMNAGNMGAPVNAFCLWRNRL